MVGEVSNMPKSSNKGVMKNNDLQSISVFIIGMGVGVLATYPVVGSHPLRFGGLLLVVGLGGYLLPMIKKS